MTRFPEMNADKMSERQLRLAIKELRSDVEFLNRLNEGQAGVNSDLRKQVDGLQQIDQALRDFNFEKYHKQREEFAREGVAQARKSRNQITIRAPK